MRKAWLMTPMETTRVHLLIATEFENGPDDLTSKLRSHGFSLVTADNDKMLLVSSKPCVEMRILRGRTIPTEYLCMILPCWSKRKSLRTSTRWVLNLGYLLFLDWLAVLVAFFGGLIIMALWGPERLGILDFLPSVMFWASLGILLLMLCLIFYNEVLYPPRVPAIVEPCIDMLREFRDDLGEELELIHPAHPNKTIREIEGLIPREAVEVAQRVLTENGHSPNLNHLSAWLFDRPRQTG